MKNQYLKITSSEYCPYCCSFLRAATIPQGGVVQIYKNATAPFDDEKQVDAALALPIHSVLVKERYQGGRFWTETRKDKIERFKCSQCHNKKPFRWRRPLKSPTAKSFWSMAGRKTPVLLYLP